MPVTTLKCLVMKRGVGDLNLMKVDAEGAEYEGLGGPGTTLRSSDVRLSMELHSQNRDRSIDDPRFSMTQFEAVAEL